MGIEIRGIGRDRALGTHIRTRLSDRLRRLAVRPLGARVAFVDEDGPKGGPALRCTVTVRLPYQPNLRAERCSADRRSAFDRAFAGLERQLERYREVQRERRRRPKKYYAARRANA